MSQKKHFMVSSELTQWKGKVYFKTLVPLKSKSNPRTQSRNDR